MQISGLQKLTLTDYPGHVASIIFTQGCNYKCPFCQNSSLIDYREGLLDECEVLDYINKRASILDGVVISGGEPTVHKDLKHFITKIKRVNLKVKLDTNGSNFKLLKELIDEGLVDYVAMDVKDVFSDYNEVAGTKVNLDEIKKSINLLKENRVSYEFRTTIIREFHDIDKILKLCEFLKGSTYYLQNFEDSSDVLRKGLHGFSASELDYLESKIRKYSNVRIRGK